MSSPKKSSVAVIPCRLSARTASRAESIVSPATNRLARKKKRACHDVSTLREAPPQEPDRTDRERGEHEKRFGQRERARHAVGRKRDVQFNRQRRGMIRDHRRGAVSAERAQPSQ